jgi:hypothetical protein
VDLQPQHTVKARVFSGSHVSPATVFELPLLCDARCSIFAAAGHSADNFMPASKKTIQPY